MERETKYRKLVVIAVLILLLNMVLGTQYAVTKISYEYYILHPSDSDIRYIGSSNASDGKRALRVEGDNITNVRVKLFLGENFTLNQNIYYTAAFGIVNEQKNALAITHINISSTQATYLKIWLHGNRTANANQTSTDPSGVLMWDNDTMINSSDTVAWILAPGDGNTNTMCYNVSDRDNTTIPTPWDERAHVRYSIDNNNAVNEKSDFVWVQIGVIIPEVVDSIGLHSGTISIHFESI